MGLPCSTTLKLSSLALSCLLLFSLINVTGINTGNKVPEQVLRYVRDDERVEEIDVVGDPNRPYLRIFKVNPSEDVLIYDVRQEDIVGGIYWKGDEIYMREVLSQYLYKRDDWFKTTVVPIIEKHSKESSMLVGLDEVGTELAKKYTQKKLISWGAGTVAGIIVVTIVTGGVVGVAAIAISLVANALSLYLTASNILKDYNFAYENYPVALYSMLSILAQQKNEKEKKNIEDTINNLLSNIKDEQEKNYLVDFIEKTSVELFTNAPSLTVSSLASYLVSLKYYRTINPKVVNDILQTKGLDWNNIKNFALGPFKRLLELFEGKKQLMILYML